MEQLQQREWYELQSRTWQLLRGRDHILRSKHRPLFQYLVRPSFTDTWSIDFVRTGDNPGGFSYGVADDEGHSRIHNRD
jgi:hypothetical protein